MTMHPRDVLTAFKPKLAPPRRMTDADTLLVEIRDKIAKAQGYAELSEPLATMLAECLHEIQLEKTSRNYPGLIGTLSSECEFASITEGV